MVQKIYSKMHPVLCTNTHHDVIDLVNHGMVKNTKTWISWKRNIIFLRNKKILKLCFRWHILRSYRLLAEVTFKFKAKDSQIVAIPLCLGNISKNFSVDNMKKTGFYGYVYDFSVDYDAIAVNDILKFINI